MSKITNTETFQAVDGLDVIVETGGGYKQVPVYQKSNIAYAKNGQSFLTLKANMQTSKMSTRWLGFVLTDEVDISYKTTTLGFVELYK